MSISIVGRVFGNNSTTNPDNLVYQKRVPLTATQIKTLNTVPITAITTPGLGKYLKILSVDVSYTFNSVPFDNGLNITIDQIPTATLFFCDTTTCFASDNIFIPLGPEDFGTGIATTTLQANTATFIRSNANSANGDGSAVFYFTYKIITI